VSRGLLSAPLVFLLGLLSSGRCVELLSHPSDLTARGFRLSFQ